MPSELSKFLHSLPVSEQIEMFSPEEVPQVTRWSTETKATSGMQRKAKRKVQQQEVNK